MARINTWGIAAALVEAGVFTQDEINLTRRIVIDINVDEVPVMYVERYTDEKLLDVLPVLGKIKIMGTEEMVEYEPRDGEEGGGQLEEQGAEGQGDTTDPIKEFIGDLGGYDYPGNSL